MEPQVFQLLARLIENRERLVSKDELVEKVWDGRSVSESAVSRRVKSARKALGDDGRAQRFVKTIHGQGFRFVAEVRASRGAADAVSAPLEAGVEAGPSATWPWARTRRPRSGVSAPRARRAPTC